MNKQARWVRMAGIVTAILICVSPPRIRSAGAQSSDVEDMLSRISRDSLLQTVRILSGEEPAVTPDSTYQITTRWYENNDGALHFLRHKLESLGYSTNLDPFEQGTNVVGVRTGSTSADRQIVLCAHYDAVMNTPGADDNASGTAAVLEVARILAPYAFSNTIVFGLWDAEEQGLFGSAHYAAQAAAAETDIAAVINLDMIGWDGDSDRVVEVHSDTASESLANTLAGYAQTYNLGLNTVIEIPGTRASDHATFWDNGYQAVLLIEEYRGGDFNPYYHQPTDVVQHFNQDFFSNAVALAVAGVAELAGVVPVTREHEPAISRNSISIDAHPSPFTTTMTVRYEVPSAATTRIQVYDLLGRHVATLADGWHSAGLHVARFNGADAPAGIYLISLEGDSGRRVIPVVKTD